MLEGAQRGLATALAWLAASPASAGPAENRQAALAAALHLETTQNADGSWGASEDIRPVYTASAVEALRAFNRHGPGHFRGLTWLENHAMQNVDYRARRLAALAPHGDDVGEDRESLKQSFSQISSADSGWGLSQAYAPSVRDSALVLLAFAQIGVAPDVTAQVQAALDLLGTAQEGDGGYRLAAGTASDAVLTALVLRALAGYVGFDPGVAAVGNAAAAFLQGAVAPGSSPLEKGQAALALLRWAPGTTGADPLIDSLVATQAPDGSWEGDVYVTAEALWALAARLGTDAASFQQVVALPDMGLRSAINLAIGRNRGDTLRRGDLLELASLDARSFGISDLSGLEQATNLGFLDLRNNQVTDVTPIAALTNAVILLQNNPWAGQLCDVTGEGAVDVRDALLASRIASGDLAPSLLQKTKTDVAPTSGPGNGVVDVLDAVVVTRGASGAAIPVCQ